MDEAARRPADEASFEIEIGHAPEQTIDLVLDSTGEEPTRAAPGIHGDEPTELALIDEADTMVAPRPASQEKILTVMREFGLPIVAGTAA